MRRASNSSRIQSFFDEKSSGFIAVHRTRVLQYYWRYISGATKSTKGAKGFPVSDARSTATRWKSHGALIFIPRMNWCIKPASILLHFYQILVWRKIAFVHICIRRCIRLNLLRIVQHQQKPICNSRLSIDETVSYLDMSESLHFGDAVIELLSCPSNLSGPLPRTRPPAILFRSCSISLQTIRTNPQGL